MTQIDINGQFYLTADNPVDHALIRFSLVDGGLTVAGIDAYDPSGPNTGSTTPGVTVNTWTENVISISTLLHQDKLVADVFLYDVTGLAYQITYNLVPDQPTIALTYPLIESVCSPAPDTIRFEGQRFQTASAGVVYDLIPRLAGYTIGPELNGPSMYVNMITPLYGWVINTFTDNVIEISNPEFTLSEPSVGPGDFVVTGAAIHESTYTNMYFYEPWDGTFSTPVDGVGCPPQIANVVPGGDNEIDITGTDLNNTTRFRVFDAFALDQFYYDSSGPNSGLNPVGSTVTVSSNLVTINDPALDGLTVTQVQARTGTLPADTVPLGAEWYGSALVA